MIDEVRSVAEAGVYSKESLPWQMCLRAHVYH